YCHWCLILKALFEEYPALAHNFMNSIFPAVTSNCGPKAISVDHCDTMSISCNLCAITSLIICVQPHLPQTASVIEFPSGASILIPSGCMSHGNTLLRTGERCSLMTQYAAGPVLVGCIQLPVREIPTFER
ncbi:hypothetical protein B0H10DRAFT_1806008, partial [Mycena sp. CBHHK59/15]